MGDDGAPERRGGDDPPPRRARHSARRHNSAQPTTASPSSPAQIRRLAGLRLLPAFPQRYPSRVSVLIPASFFSHRIMAHASRPGPLNPPFGVCQVPDRTSGTLGLLDQGDPNATSLLGNTPGALGLRDWADPDLDDIVEAALRSIGVIGRARHGTSPPPAAAPAAAPGSASPPTQTAAVPEIELARAQEMALMITTVFEGGKSMNYAALADDFDGMGTSFGLIQWNFGSNTLGPLLKKMQTAGEVAFAACFPESADYPTLKAALNSNSKADQLKWARDLIKKDREAWSAAFKAIGSNPVFNQIQREQASAKYHPAVVSVIALLRKMSPDLLSRVEFRSYAALFDLCVQQGNIDKAIDAIESRVKSEKPDTQRALMEIAAVERGRSAKAEWVSDCISRRMGILSGGAFESTENKVTKKRNNPQYALITEHGTKTVAGL